MYKLCFRAWKILCVYTVLLNCLHCMVQLIGCLAGVSIYSESVSSVCLYMPSRELLYGKHCVIVTRVYVGTW